MMPAPLSQQYNQQPPGYGYQQQQQQQQPIPPYNPAMGHSSTVGHNDVPSPGDIHLSFKAYFVARAIWFITGMFAGGAIMFKVFPIFIRTLQAAAGA